MRRETGCATVSTIEGFTGETTLICFSIPESLFNKFLKDFSGDMVERRRISHIRC